MIVSSVLLSVHLFWGLKLSMIYLFEDSPISFSRPRPENGAELEVGENKEGGGEQGQQDENTRPPRRRFRQRRPKGSRPPKGEEGQDGVVEVICLPLYELGLLF